MNTEIEAKFLNIDHEAFRQKLTESGATLIHPMRLMKRAIIETPTMRQRNSFIRVRDEGDKVTLTHKQFESLSVDGAKEVEVIVSDFNSVLHILAEVDLTPLSTQESKRETWTLNDVEIVLDEWPWLNSYIEIEGATEESLKYVAKKLGLEWNDAVFGDVMAAYRVQYPHLTLHDTVADIPSVRFGDPLPGLLKNAIL